MQISGQNNGGSYDYVVTINGTTKRAKRDGRNPSTGAFTAGQSTKVVEDSLTINTGIGAIKVNIPTYDSANEISSREEYEE